MTRTIPFSASLSVFCLSALSMRPVRSIVIFWRSSSISAWAWPRALAPASGMLISKSQPNRAEVWVIAAIGLYLARRSRTTGLLKRVIESSFDPSTVHYLKTFENVLVRLSEWCSLTQEKRFTHHKYRGPKVPIGYEQEWPTPCSLFYSFSM